jgi:23S rRNA pseudouridine2605 synthase
VPLVRALSKLGLASRSEAVALVRDGRVAVDGRVVRDPGAAVVPETMSVAIDGTPRSRAMRQTIALHKPRGVVTTRRDPEGRPTVHDLLAGAAPGVAPIGRLDLASSGLLLCTNDTPFGAWLTDPASAVEREYIVTVRGRLDPSRAASLEVGRELDGEWLQPSRVTVIKASGRETHLGVVLTEGKNREIRRLFEALGHEVTRLLRVRIGGVSLGRLAPGRWQLISEEKRALAFPEYPGGRSGRPRRPATAR